MTDWHKLLAVYFIAGTQDIVTTTLPEVLECALKAGITCFQYREKGPKSLTNRKAVKQMAKACQALCQAYHVPFLIDDDVLLAKEIAADGIHVGQSDQAIETVIQQFPNKIIGLSCHTKTQIQQANRFNEISYVGVGPIYTTASKEDAKPPIGLKTLAELTQQSKKPIVAIGGLSTENVPEVVTTGVAGVAVISAITRAKRIDQVVKDLKQSF